MRIIEIVALSNGAHRNQTGSFKDIPEGWAVIPDDMEIPATFPFVNIEVQDGIVTAMTEGVVPDTETTPESNAQDDTDAMLVDHEYRLTLLELGV